MEETLRYFADACAGRGLAFPVRITVTHKMGVPWWLWIDRDGKPCPPPSTIA